MNLHFAFQSDENCYLVLDLAMGGDLGYHIRKKGHFQEGKKPAAPAAAPTGRPAAPRVAPCVGCLLDRRAQTEGLVADK